MNLNEIIFMALLILLIIAMSIYVFIRPLYYLLCNKNKILFSLKTTPKDRLKKVLYSLFFISIEIITILYTKQVSFSNFLFIGIFIIILHPVIVTKNGILDKYYFYDYSKIFLTDYANNRLTFKVRTGKYSRTKHTLSCSGHDYEKLIKIFSEHKISL